MTDFANLAIQIDASQTKAATAELDKLTTAGARTEAATQALASAQAQAKTVIDAYKAALKEGTITQEQYNLGALNTKQGLLALEAEYRAATSAMTKMSLASQGVHASAGAQRAAMQQLSYQIGDVSQGFALGVNPMVIFAQQGGQVIQALTLMQGEAKGLLGFLGGPWGAVVIGAATVVGMLWSKLGDAASGMDSLQIASSNTSDVQKQLSGIFNMTTGAINNQTPAVIALARAHLMLAQAKAQAGITDARAKIKDAATPAWYEYISFTDTRSPEQLRRDRSSGIGASDALSGNLTGAIAKLSEAAKAGKITNDQFGQLSATYGDLLQNTENLKTATDGLASINSGKLAPSLAKTTTAHAAHAAAVKDDTAAITQFAEAMALAGANLTGFLTVQSGKQATADLKWEYTHMFDGMNDEYKKHLEQLREAAAWQDIINEGVRKQQDEYISLGQSIARIGGIGGTLGGIIGALGGDAGGLSPALQNILGTKTGGKVDVFGSDGVKTGQRDKTLLDGITSIFKGKDGTFGKTMGEVLGGAGSGLAIGTALFGSGNTGAQVGGAIGGAIGTAVGGAIGGPAGAAIGNAIMSTVGSLLGGLIGGPKRGTVSFTNSGNQVTNSKTGDLVNGINTTGGAIQTAIGNIADQLGGTVGNYGFTIGMRNDEYRVSGAAGANVQDNVSGLLYRGKDAQAAAQAALLNAIQDGAIAGIRQGAQNLLKAGGDINTALSKALKFNSVFDDLKQATDPMAYALDTITKKFDGLRKLFDEAGASASDYADLEKLLGIERQKSIDSARQAVVDNLRDPLTMQIKILEMLGQSEEALAGSRLMELAGMKATLQPLQEMIYQLSDAQDIIAKFSPLAAGLRAFRTELLGNGGDQSYGFLAAQFRSTASAAAMGDATAMGNLRGTATSFLDAAKANATSGLEYRRAVGEVLAGVDKGIFAADTQVEYAQLQIDAIKNTNTILADMKAELATLQSQVVVNTNATLKLWRNVIPNGDAIIVNTNASDPLQVEVVTP